MGWARFTTFFLFLFLARFDELRAQTCQPVCASTIQSKSEKETQLARVQDILQKNEDYLKKNPQASPSISVKVRSNILMSKLQIETLQNQMQLIDKAFKEKGCQGCKSIKKES